MSELDRHFKRVQQIIERDYSASLMNNTRWTVLMDALRGQPLWWRYKLVGEERVYGWTRHVSCGAGSGLPPGWIEGASSPVRFLELEWLEVQPVEDLDGKAAAEIEQRLTSGRVPFVRSGAVFRVTGHLPRPQPEPG